MGDYFKKHYKEVSYPIGTEFEPGLRNSQLGAIHAIASYYSIECERASLTIMPTGSGKTAVLMLAPYLINSSKVLIVTPSAMVRSQIYEDYKDLRTLKKAKVFRDSIKPPEVYELKNLYRDYENNNISKSEVVIATHICARSLSEDKNIKLLFDTVVIDEAHHVPAKTWAEILRNMNHCKKLLFTATPFRLDKKEVKGEIIYSYPLSKAYEDGVFGEITYCPVDESSIIPKDVLLAKKAEEVFKKDKESGFEHYLMARTDTREKAKALELIYSQETSLRLKRIDSTMSSSDVSSIIELLKDCKIDGIICVDMLGEGFDFPKLKIAVVHEPHKSLASTLQFIGRFARTNAEKIGKAKFIAINNEELIIENKRLYSSDAIWQKMIVDMSEFKTKEEQETKEFINRFTPASKGFYDEIDISLYSLRPNSHAKIFEVRDFNILGEFPRVCNVDQNYLINNQDNTIVGIGIDEEKPLWMGGTELMNMSFNLYIVHYQEATSLLFIYSSNKNETIYEAIAESFCITYKRIPRYKMNRVLGKLNDFEIFNSGLQSRYIENGESYRISTGSNVANNIDPLTGRLYSPGHVFCKANNDEDKVTIGYSSSGKIWSHDYLSISDYVRWCDENGYKIVDQTINIKTNTNLDSLTQSEELLIYPDNIFMADFYHETYLKPPFIDRINGIVVENVKLTDFDLSFNKVENNRVIFKLIFNDFESILSCNHEGNYKVEANDNIEFLNEKVSIVDYFNSYPILFKTTDDITIIGNELLRGNPDGIQFNIDDIVDINWDDYDTDVTLEFRTEETPIGLISLHDTIREILFETETYKYIIYDHSTGEIADFIGIKIKDKKIQVTLIHVKRRVAKGYNSSVSELYEVCGQSVKSAIWLRSKKDLLKKIKARRKSGYCKFLKGDFLNLEKDLNGNFLLRGQIIAVQPSITSTLDFEEKTKNVIAAASSYLKNVGYINQFLVWGSALSAFSNAN